MLTPGEIKMPVLRCHSCNSTLIGKGQENGEITVYHNCTPKDVREGFAALTKQCDDLQEALKSTREVLDRARINLNRMAAITPGLTATNEALNVAHLCSEAIAALRDKEPAA